MQSLINVASDARRLDLLEKLTGVSTRARTLLLRNTFLIYHSHGLGISLVSFLCAVTAPAQSSSSSRSSFEEKVIHTVQCYLAWHSHVGQDVLEFVTVL